MNQTLKIIGITILLNLALKPGIPTASLKHKFPVNNLKIKLSSQSDTINASTFGVRADYNGSYGTDNTKKLQLAIDYCAQNRKTLQLPAGKILLNSYAGTLAAKAHGNILELKSNLKIIGYNSEIVVGSFFHDKNFIVLSGLNTSQPTDFKALTNVVLKNFSINFNAAKSFMKTQYLLRKGIEFGHTINGEVAFCKLFNGDLSCGIATGYGQKNWSKNINIHDNEFQNLVVSKQNRDHTSVYINSTNSSVMNNKFSNSSLQGKLVACATELHNSDTNFIGNKITGYTRMMFLVTTPSENMKISNLLIAKNEAYITNAAIYLWLDKNTAINGVLIENNIIINTHVPGYSMLYNGTQGIIADARNEENTIIENMQILNNKTYIKNTVISGRAVNYATKFKFVNKNNSCEGCSDGNYYNP